MNSTYEKCAIGYNVNRLSRISEQLSKVQELIIRFNEQAMKEDNPIIIGVDNNYVAANGEKRFQLHLFQFYEGRNNMLEFDHENKRWSPSDAEHYEIDNHGNKFFVLKIKEQEDEVV